MNSPERPWADPASFLADERAKFAPFEAILRLDATELDHGRMAHGWSARDLLAHLAGWHEVAAEVAHELRASPDSPRKQAADEAWERHGDALNEEIRTEWGRLPVEEFRARARRATEDLRDALAALPPERWWGNAEYFEYFLSEMQEHYQDHRAALAQILGPEPDPG
jgi:Mycothiol maleylpyruvate isomerase N-terminal domain